MVAAIAELVECRTQLKATQAESATWRVYALKTIEVLGSLKKFTITLET